MIRRLLRKHRERRDTKLSGTCPKCGIYRSAHRLCGHGAVR